MGSNLTPVTPETFAKWKRTRLDKKQAEDEAQKKAKDAQAAAGKVTGMSGRDLFSYNPDWFEEEESEEEEEEWDIAKFRKAKEEEEAREEEARMEELRRGFEGVSVVG